MCALFLWQRLFTSDYDMCVGAQYVLADVY